LDVREIARQPLAASVEASLQGRELLLVLDNFEQILPAAGIVADLLAACPALRVLVTSRAPLHLRAEQEFAVEPLMLPPAGAGATSIDAVYASSAVQLFVERARAVRPNFALTDANAPVLAEICRRLDGLPLALELAAARSKLLPPEALLARLVRAHGRAPLQLLTDGPRDLPARQQTLRAAIAWSYDLLAPPEQILFRRLAVFVGGGTLDAMEAICDATNDLGMDVLDGVTSLANQSLLQTTTDTDGLLRVGMLETIREFGLERLADSGEGDALRRRHAVFYLALAAEAESRLRGPEQQPWLERLEREHDNFRMALDWSRSAAHEQELHLRLVGALWPWWKVHGHFREAQGRLAEAVSRRDGTAAAVQAKALRVAGSVATFWHDYDGAEALLKDSLTLSEEVEDRRGIAAALYQLGHVARARRDTTRATALFEKCLALARGLGDRCGMADALTALAWLALIADDFDRAQTLYEESLALLRALGDRHGAAIQLMALGDIAGYRRDYEQATALYEESLGTFHMVGAKTFMAFTLIRLAILASDRREHDLATALLVESLNRIREIGSSGGIAGCLEGLALVAIGRGQAAWAARLFGAAEALREAIDEPVLPPFRARYERAAATVRSVLDEAAFARAWGAGRALPLEQAIADALALAAEIATPPDVAHRSEPSSAAQLSAREAQVLRLLADGQSNKEIARELALSVHTVERHLANVYAKIGARGRADAVAYALRHGLA
jgi:predicted ATPase/DNA-binding CsgD family transcriptional regulator